MKLFVRNDHVVIDAEREAALLEFARGKPLPPERERSVDRLIAWFDDAIEGLDTEDEIDAMRYSGLVLDKQYLRLVQRGLIDPR